MRPHIDHVELTVSDLSRAERFYDALLPLLGFDLRHKGRGDFSDFDHTEIDYATADFSLGLVSPRPELAGEGVCRRKPGALHHLAFAADSRGGGPSLCTGPRHSRRADSDPTQVLSRIYPGLLRFLFL